MSAWDILKEVWPYRLDIRTASGAWSYPDVIPGADAYLQWVRSLPEVKR